MTHVTACKSAGRQDRDSIALILKRNSAQVSLGQTDQLLVVHTYGRYKLHQQICENQANLLENQCMKMCPTSSSSQHHASSSVVAVDVVHKILASQSPESEDTFDF